MLLSYCQIGLEGRTPGPLGRGVASIWGSKWVLLSYCHINLEGSIPGPLGREWLLYVAVNGCCLATLRLD